MHFDFQSIQRFIDDNDKTSYHIFYPPYVLWKPIQEGVVRHNWQRQSEDDRRGLYIHIPFCKTKCTFCRYYSVAAASNSTIETFLASLLKEAVLLSRSVAGKQFRNLYIGGGTPSILTTAQLKRIFSALDSVFCFKPGKQIIFEANPEFLDLEKIQFLKDCGVTRLTLGVQTLNRELLKALKRTQDIRKVYRAYDDARRVGIPAINIDLMYGLPFQSESDFLSDLRAVVNLSPEMIHMSRFLPTSFTGVDREAAQKSTNAFSRSGNTVVRDFLKLNGYYKAAFDAWTKNAKATNNQLTEVVRDYASYAGLGPGAVSRISGKLYYANTFDLRIYRKYLAHGMLPVDRGYRIHRTDAMRDYVMEISWYGIIPKERFKKLFGVTLEQEFGKEIAWLREQGILIEKKKLFSFETTVRNLELTRILFFDPRHMNVIMRRMHDAQ